MDGVPRHRPESLREDQCGPRLWTLSWKQLEALEEFMEQREETPDVQSPLRTVGHMSGCREVVPRSQESQGSLAQGCHL